MLMWWGKHAGVLGYFWLAQNAVRLGGQLHPSNHSTGSSCLDLTSTAFEKFGVAHKCGNTWLVHGLKV